jgi:anaphase-promoting complex subunit 2
LKECVERTAKWKDVIVSLKAVMVARLLKPGANTEAILSMYIKAIKALRKLDSSGIVLDMVCGPIRKYLQQREDTVRCIIKLLIDRENDEFREELASGDTAMAESDDSVRLLLALLLVAAFSCALRSPPLLAYILQKLS